MSIAKHTPGPWNYTLCDDETAWMIGPRDTDGPDYVADVHKLVRGRSHADSEANARLIAAGPELLAACKAAIASLSQPVMANASSSIKGDVAFAIKNMSVAIAKATGEVK